MRWGWSTEENHWNNLENFVEENQKYIEWKHITATYRLVNNVPENSGVYSFNVSRGHTLEGSNTIYPNLYDSNDDIMNSLYSPIYIGISDNLRSRFRSHMLRNPKIKQAVDTFSNSKRTSLVYSWTEFPKILTRDYERYLIAVFGPTLNNQS